MFSGAHSDKPHNVLCKHRRRQVNIVLKERSYTRDFSARMRGGPGECAPCNHTHTKGHCARDWHYAQWGTTHKQMFYVLRVSVGRRGVAGAHLVCVGRGRAGNTGLAGGARPERTLVSVLSA